MIALCGGLCIHIRPAGAAQAGGQVGAARALVREEGVPDHVARVAARRLLELAVALERAQTVRGALAVDEAQECRPKLARRGARGLGARATAAGSGSRLRARRGG
jgi:hypothetical protein